jgi:hypothetical protein
MGETMNFYDKETDVFQGSMAANHIFVQSQILTSDAIKIDRDLVETLRIAGCEFIQAVVETRPGHFEPHYPSLQTFMENAVKVGNQLVYKVPEEDYEVINERAEVRSNLTF